MEYPRIGIGVIVVNDMGQVLMGVRKKSGPGFGKWHFPGGHLEMYESLETCGWRETFEESEIEIDTESIKILDVSNNPWPEHKAHYVTIFLLARYKSGTPRGVEPDKCDHWTWLDLDNMPPDDQLFESISILTAENKAKIKGHALTLNV